MSDNEQIHVLLYGAGGHARVVADCVTATERKVLGFFDDDEELISMNGWEILGEYDAEFHPKVPMIVTIGDNMARKKAVSRSEHLYTSVVHPSAIFSPYARIDYGSVVVHGAIVQSGARIGKHAIINTGATIDHDCQIGDFSHISPQVTLCGGVSIGEGTHVGAGATVIPNISIGKWCVIGAGAVITQDLEDYSFVVGVPGKVIRKVEL